MIFINHTKNAKAAKDYYTQHIAPGDYYSKDAAEMPGIWHGKGGERLGLSGEVKKEEVFALCENADPRTGEQLTPRMRLDRRVLTDITFDAPKSVTLAYEPGGDHRVLDSFREAVRETMADIERDTKTRVRTKGKDSDRPTGNLVWAEHIHRTTRPVDGEPQPQLHCHATVFNATWDDVESRWKAVQLGDVVRDKSDYQAAFHARLAYKLRILGYGIEKDRKCFRLAGISRETVEKFSKRTAIIEGEAERLGIENALAKGHLGRRTRESKAPEAVAISDLQRKWRAAISEEEYRSIVDSRHGGGKGDAFISAHEAQAYALEHCFQNASVVSEKKVRAEALIHGVGSILPADVSDIAMHDGVIYEDRGDQRMLTTKAVLNDEVRMLQFAKDGQRKERPFLASNPRTQKERAISFLRDESGQNRALCQMPIFT